MSSNYSFFSLHILSSRFLIDDWIDFLEIFRVDITSNDLNRVFSFFRISLPVAEYGQFSFFKERFCPRMFSEVVVDRELKFSEMIDLK